MTRGFYDGGYQLDARLVGERVVALGFVDAQGVSRGIRVVTARGLVLALDAVPKGPLADRQEYYLHVPTMFETLDVDQDGFEEIWVREVGRAGGDCLRGYRVQPNGQVELVPLALERFGAGSCVRGLGDRDDNGVVELELHFVVDSLPLSQWPEVQVLLFPDGAHGFGVEGPEALTAAHYGGQVAERTTNLAAFTAAQNGPEVYRVAAELALLAHLSGQSEEAQRKQLEEQFKGLQARDTALEAAIMAHVAEGW